LGEDLIPRERDVVEKADPQVGAVVPQQSGHKLQLIVVHPHLGVRGGCRGGGDGEPLVDLGVGVPPAAVELRWGDHVVVKRPQRRVGKALVEGFYFLLRKRHGDQVDAAGLERLRCIAGGPRPADPAAAGLGHDWLQCGDQPSRAGLPLCRPVGSIDAVYRQPVRDHDDVTAADCRRRPGERDLSRRRTVGCVLRLSAQRTISSSVRSR